MNYNEKLGTYLQVACFEDTQLMIKSHELTAVRKAVKDYREKDIDTLLEIEHVDGTIMGVVASTIYSYFLSTPETRESDVVMKIQEALWVEDVKKEHLPSEWEEPK